MEFYVSALMNSFQGMLQIQAWPRSDQMTAFLGSLVYDTAVSRSLRRLASTSLSLHFTMLACRAPVSLIRRPAGSKVDASVFCEAVEYYANAVTDIQSAPIDVLLSPGLRVDDVVLKKARVVLRQPATTDVDGPETPQQNRPQTSVITLDDCKA